MRKSPSVLWGLLALFFCGIPLPAEPSRPSDDPQQQIELEHLVILYPEALSREARVLAGFAEDEYADLSKRFGFTLDGKFPVVLSGRNESANGYFTPFYRAHLQLQLGSIDPNSEIGQFGDNLRSIFRHELTHAFSLSLKSPFWHALSSVFGSLLTPAILASSSLAEGIAVSSESEGGFGRLQDPLFTSLVVQDVLEQKDNNFWDASGASNRRNRGQLWYAYGSTFSRWLQDTFGDEKFLDVWRFLGDGTDIDGSIFGKGAFEKALGTPLDALWTQYLNSMRPRGPVYFSAVKLGHLSSAGDALASLPQGLLWVNGQGPGIQLYDPEAGTQKLVAPADLVSRIAVSSSGQTVLVSYSRIVQGLYRNYVRRLDLDRGFAGTEFPELTEACPLGDSGDFLAVQTRGYETDLVVHRGSGTTVIARGSPEVAFGQPVDLDGTNAACVVKIGGVSRLALFSTTNPAAPWRLSTAQTSPRDLRWLSRTPRGLIFSWARLGSLVRVGELDLGANTLRLQAHDVSGGVREPVVYDAQGIYGVSAFADDHVVSFFPAGDEGLQTSDQAVVWEDFTPTTDIAPAPESPTLVATAYNPFPWVLPGTWLPTAKLGGDFVDAAGIVLIGADVTDTLSYNATFTYDPVRQFLNTTVAASVGKDHVIFQGQVVDDVSYASALSAYQRNLQVQGIWSWNLNGFPSTNTADFSVALGGFSSAAAVADQSAYLWPLGKPGVFADVNARFSNQVASRWRKDWSRGVRLGLDANTGLDQNLDWGNLLGRVASTATIDVAASWDSLHLSSYFSAASPDLVVLAPSGPRFLTGNNYPVALPEGPFAAYGSHTAGGWYYLFGEAGMVLLSLPIDQNFIEPGFFFPGIHLNGLTLDAGYRAAWYGADYLQAVYVKTKLAMSLLVGLSAGARLEPILDVAYALGTQTWSASFSFQVE